jgi:arylsulfatase A-like enzyme
MALKANPDLGYSTAAIGKWHLADEGNGWINHPNLAGFDHFAGLMDGGPRSYFAWNKVVNGEVIGKVGYTPADKVDDAIAWLDVQNENPWFLWFAFNLGHALQAFAIRRPGRILRLARRPLRTRRHSARRIIH